MRDRVKEVMLLFGKPGDMVYECDCWQFDLSLCPNVDVFCYDAAHDEASQERAMTYFHPCWRDEVVVFVDDWAGDGVERGTRKGLAQIPFTVEWETCLPREISATESQANGLFAAVLKRGR